MAFLLNLGGWGTEETRPKQQNDGIKFHLNGVEQFVTPNETKTDTRLVDYIRYTANLKGTKFMCREGGCGACIVVATAPEPDGGTKSFSVQACQTLVYACANWSIETIEHLGDRYKGYHPLQKALAGFYGTQCGFCSPGMVMTMYGEEKRTNGYSQKQVEEALDGNICRCTGYRPILDAFKSRAWDATMEQKMQYLDIEDSYKNICPSTGKSCASQCCTGPCGGKKGELQTLDEIFINATEGKWFRPVTMEGLCNAVKTATASDNILFVGGNTGAGVFKNDGPFTMYINLDGVPELHQVQNTTSPLVLGSRVPLTRCIDIFRKASCGNESIPGCQYLEEVANHWQVVANLAVRNNGSWAGNLMMKNKHNEFPSDIFLTLSAIDATLLIKNCITDADERVKVIDFQTYDMKNKILVSVTIPDMKRTTLLRTYKITPRAVNAHAYVNAAFRFDLDENFTIIDKPVILFGGLGQSFISASNTESFLQGKVLSDEAVVKQAAGVLSQEAIPAVDPHQGSVAYRKNLVQALLYKTVIWLLKDRVPPSLASAATKLIRPISKGSQQYDVNADTWPMGKAIPKLESNIQVAGEAVFADDIPYLPGELHGAFASTNVANAKIERVDATRALAVEGVVDFVTAADVPGKNTFTSGAFAPMSTDRDKIFATDHSAYCGQPIGLIVAKDRETALRAAKLVDVTYSNRKKPILKIKDAINPLEPRRGYQSQDVDKVVCLTSELNKKSDLVDPKDDKREQFLKTIKQATNQISGEIDLPSQYHFPMELYTSLVVPTEDGYDVVICSQWPVETQTIVATALNVPANSVNVTVRRVGGAYGSKLTRVNLTAGGAAVASAKHKKPVRVFLDLESQMKLLGWREPYYASYKAGFDDTGKFDAVDVQLYNDVGYINMDNSIEVAAHAMPSVYDYTKVNVTPKSVNTDTAANTWCRTPGHVEAIAIIENIIEHIAHTLGKDPMDIRRVNMNPDGSPLITEPNVFNQTILPMLEEKAMLAQRKTDVELFNQNNRWKKRGISVTPLKYPFPFISAIKYSAQVMIHAHDGSVDISHGGIEMGQGIHTKAAQVAASILQIPLETIKMKPTNTLIGANSAATGGSFGSDFICHAVKICCDRLISRINAVKEALPEPKPDWGTLVKICLFQDVDLSERYWTISSEHPKPYNIWAGAVIEVEIDVLTGQHMTRRADLIEDAGRSISPYVDIGQVEGSFIMGLGFFTSEFMEFNEETGEKLVKGTWEYKPFTASDIPADLRVTLLPNAPNPYGVVRSKATGEPPLCMSYGIITALRQAIASARADAGNNQWFEMPLPATVERIQQLCLVDSTQFNL